VGSTAGEKPAEGPAPPTVDDEFNPPDDDELRPVNPPGQVDDVDRR
jgi:hypothetical protein